MMRVAFTGGLYSEYLRLWVNFGGKYNIFDFLIYDNYDRKKITMPVIWLIISYSAQFLSAFGICMSSCLTDSFNDSTILKMDQYLRKS